MKRADLDTAAVLTAVAAGDAYDSLCGRYPPKIVAAAFERETRRGNLEYGVSERTPWLTPQGREHIPGIEVRTRSVPEILSDLRGLLGMD